MTWTHRFLRTPAILVAAVVGLGLTSCASPTVQPGADESQTAATPALTPPPGATPSESGGPTTQAEESIVGTVVRFTAGEVLITVTIEEDNAATRSFLQMLPMTVEFSDYGGKEKVATPTGEFDFAGVPGSNARVGDLFSYKPWGNIGFFYNDEGNTFSESLATLGTTPDADQIELLDGREVTIAVAKRQGHR